MSWPYLARGGGQVEMEACTPSRKACLGLGEGNTAPTDAAWRHPEHQDWEPPPEHPLPTHHPAPGPQPSLRIVFLCPLLLASLTRPGAGSRRHPNISLRVNLIQGCSQRRRHYSHARGSLGRGPSAVSYGHTSPREGLDLNPEGALLPGCVFCTVYITKAKLGSHAVSRGWSCWALGCPLPHLPQMLPPPTQVTRLIEAEVVRAGWPSQLPSWCGWWASPWPIRGRQQSISVRMMPLPQVG